MFLKNYEIHGISLGTIIVALPDFQMAVVYIVTWFNPSTFGDKMIAHLILIMLFEFIVIHSSGFMGKEFIKSKKSAVGLGLFYTVFVAIFSISFDTLWPLFLFWILTLNRFVGFLFNRKDNTSIWVVSLLFYMCSIFLTSFLPVPSLGITESVIQQQNLSNAGGLWVDKPQTVIFSGFLYFTAQGLNKLLGQPLIKS